MNSEWNRLDAATKVAVQSVIDEARRTGNQVSQTFRTGDVYAYPHANGAAWGVNCGPGGINSARGVVP